MTDGQAYLILGYTYQNGDADISEDIDIAMKYFEKAAKLGNSEALVTLGSIYEYDKKDYESAKSMYEKAIKLGNSDAMYNLANMYENGRGIEKDYEKALEYYEKASEKDHSASLYRIGLFYEKGMGVEENIDKAIEYYEKAAKLNNKKAKEALVKLKMQIKNIILHFTSYAKLVFSTKDIIDFRIYDIKKSIYLNSTTNEMQEEKYTTCAIFTLKKECNKILNIEHDGMVSIKAKPFDYIDNGGQIIAIEFIYEDGTNEYIKVALFGDSPEPENNFHCESKILEKGDLYVRLDERINEDLSGIECK